jgi:hypothetical protein
LEKLLIGCGLALLLVGSAACGGGGDKTIDIGDGEVSIGDDLPDSFPDDFPIYDGADLQSAIQGEQDGIEGIVATWTTGDDVDDVRAFYDEQFDGDPWSTTTEGTAGGTAYWTVENSTGKVGYVAVSDGDDVTIMATVGDDPNRASSDGDVDDGSDDGSDDDSDSGDDGSDDSSDDGDSSDFPEAEVPDEVDLPSDFPSDIVPIIDGARVTAANTVTVNGIETFTIALYSKDTADEVASFYKAELEGKGYTQSIQTSDGNGVYAAYSENSDGTGKIIVVTANESDVEGYRQIVLQVSQT